jgi:hypothetical protein
MMSHLESHHPWPIKTALSSGSLLRINDRAFHNSPELNAAVTLAASAGSNASRQETNPQ